MNIKTLILSFVLLYSHATYAKIYIVCTAALIEYQQEMRKQEYIHSLATIQQLGHEPYVIEAYKKTGPTFLEDYTNHVFYSTMNNPHARNKGVNEGRTMLEGLRYFNFDDDDIIIKLTGRYAFISSYLIDTIEKNQHIDAFVRSIDHNTQIFTGCFAMRYKYLVAMLESFHYPTMERCMINIEFEVARYVKKQDQQQKIQVLYLDKVDVQGKIFGYGPLSDHTPLTIW